MPPRDRVERIIGGLTFGSGQFRIIGTPGTIGTARTTPGTAVMPAGLDDAVPPDMVSEHTVPHYRDVCSATMPASTEPARSDILDGDSVIEVDAARSAKLASAASQPDARAHYDGTYRVITTDRTEDATSTTTSTRSDGTVTGLGPGRLVPAPAAVQLQQNVVVDIPTIADIADEFIGPLLLGDVPVDPRTAPITIACYRFPNLDVDTAELPNLDASTMIAPLASPDAACPAALSAAGSPAVPPCMPAMLAFPNLVTSPVELPNLDTTTMIALPASFDAASVPIWFVVY